MIQFENPDETIKALCEAFINTSKEAELDITWDFSFEAITKLDDAKQTLWGDNEPHSAELMGIMWTSYFGQILHAQYSSHWHKQPEEVYPSLKLHNEQGLTEINVFELGLPNFAQNTPFLQLFESLEPVLSQCKRR